MTLTTKQKQELKAKAHSLKPIILVGNQGLTAGVHNEINRGLDDHELIKIRFPSAEKAVKQVLAQEICTKHVATFIQFIGNVATFYRKAVDTKK